MSETTITSIEYVDPCPGMKGDDVITSTCTKCAGTGTVDYGNVTVSRNIGGHNVNDRWCFDCGGNGDLKRTVKNMRAAARREHKALVARQAESAAQAAERDVWAAAHPGLATRLAIVFAEVSGNNDADERAAYAAADRYGDFIVSLASRAQYRSLTEGQTDAIAKALTEYDARITAEAERADAQRYFGAEGDKVAVTGTVITAITVEGYHGSSRLIVVEGSGEFEGVTAKAFGTAASLWETERGDVVEMTGTIKGHEEYQGTKQTTLTRTKIKALSAA